MGNLVVVAWDSGSVWDGKHSIGTSDLVWRGPITIARNEIVSQVPVS